jgi:DNA-binding NtrC family response regulator
VQLSASAIAALAAHPWPGNVRALEHAIERAVVLSPGPEILPEQLGLRRGKKGSGGVEIPLGLSLQEVERRYVAATLAAHGGNTTRTAQALGVGRNTVKRKKAQLPR